MAIAATRRARLLGLAGLRGPLLLAPCRSVHTAWMRRPLDLVWLDAAGAVVRVDRAVPPWRVRSCRAARAVIEAPGGADAVLRALGADQSRVVPPALCSCRTDSSSSVGGCPS